jgi:putative flippase GtrA
MRFGKFSLVGLLGAALQVILFELLVTVPGLPRMAAAAIAVEAALLHNFSWHERFTWRDRGGIGLTQRARRLGWFHVTNGLVSLCGNTVLIYLFEQELKAPALASAVAAIACCAPANFVLADRCVYRGGARDAL